MTKDYAIDFERGRVWMPVSGEARTVQNLHKRLLTEKGCFPMYGEDYGISTADLIGRDGAYALPEFCRRVQVCCLADENVKHCTVTAETEEDVLSAAVTIRTVFSTNTSEVKVHV